MDLEGGCACGAVRYRLTAPPLIVHACRDCQKLTGSAFRAQHVDREELPGG